MKILRSLAFVAAVALTLAACAPPSPIEDAGAGVVVEPSAFEQLPVVAVAVREQVQAAVPELVVEPEPEDRAYTHCATALITRWEISNQAAYERKWSGIYYPAGPITASGPTGGIGYDFGHQTRFDIRRDWEEHRERERLATASGVIGVSAKQRIGEWRGITVGYPHALGVFAAASLPKYTAQARRLYGAANWDSLEAEGRCGLVGNAYNRGTGTAGARRAEIRERRDVCLPQRGQERLECIARTLVAEQRLWPDSRGLRDRRADEARVVLGTIILPSEVPKRPAPRTGSDRLPGAGPATIFASAFVGAAP